MAYTKQTWTNDVTAITAERMTHIEDGIYDNSLATDKINPSGTATTTAEIEEGQITDVIGFKSLKLKGQTSQETTQGNNLLNIYARHPVGYTETVSGVTFTYNNDGSVSARGTATADINFFLASNGQLGDDIFNGTNYLSGCTGGSSTTFHLQFWADTIGHFQNTTTEVATNKTAGVNWNITIGIKNGVAINKTFYPMMCATSGKTFEKYSGGIASPNPDFPQEVENVSGYNAVGINNKNLLKLKNDSKVESGTTIKISDTGTIELSGTSSAGINYIQIPENFYLDAGTYTIKTSVTGTSTKPQAFVLYNGSTVLSNITYNVSGDNATFTLSERTQITKISFWVTSGTVNTNFKAQIQLEKGSSATPYIAHQGNNFDINLGKNLIEDETFVQGSYLDNTSTTRISCRNAKLKANTTYMISSTLNYSNYNVAIVTSPNQFPLTNSSSVKYDSGWKNANFSFTTGNDDVYINIAVKKLPDGVVITPNDVKGIKFQIEKGAIATLYAPYFTPIEICKIGNYQDYIYKKDGIWWKHKAIEKIILNGTESWVLDGALTNTNRFRLGITSYNIRNLAVAGAGFSNQLKIVNAYSDESEHLYTYKPSSVMHLYVFYTKTRCADLAGLQTWLSANNLIIYGILNTPTDEEITYAPLLRQLDELYNSGLYDVTNISQDNSSEAFVLDLEACKNNINGIVEYIRR